MALGARMIERLDGKRVCERELRYDGNFLPSSSINERPKQYINAEEFSSTG